MGLCSNKGQCYRTKPGDSSVALPKIPIHIAWLCCITCYSQVLVAVVMLPVERAGLARHDCSTQCMLEQCSQAVHGAGWSGYQVITIVFRMAGLMAPCIVTFPWTLEVAFNQHASAALTTTQEHLGVQKLLLRRILHVGASIHSLQSPSFSSPGMLAPCHYLLTAHHRIRQDCRT